MTRPTRTWRGLFPCRARAIAGGSVLSVAATGKLQAQIAQGSRHEVFLSSDTARPARAEAAGRVVAGSLVPLGRGAFAAPDVAVNRTVLGPPLALMRLVVPNPVTSSHGAAANAVCWRVPPAHPKQRAAAQAPTAPALIDRAAFLARRRAVAGRRGGHAGGRLVLARSRRLVSAAACGRAADAGAALDAWSSCNTRRHATSWRHGTRPPGSGAEENDGAR